MIFTLNHREGSIIFYLMAKDTVKTVVLDTVEKVMGYQPISNELKWELINTKRLTTIDGEGQIRVLVYSEGISKKESCELMVEAFLELY